MLIHFFNKMVYVYMTRWAIQCSWHYCIFFVGTIILINFEGSTIWAQPFLSDELCPLGSCKRGIIEMIQILVMIFISLKVFSDFYSILILSLFSREISLITLISICTVLKMFVFRWALGLLIINAQLGGIFFICRTRP